MSVWLTELRRNLPSDIILHVVGTKADLVAKDPSCREVPFERCIAYIAENLAPGASGTPPATAMGSTGSAGGIWGLGGERGDRGSYENRGGLWGAPTPTGGAEGARSPSSKRSSGFWGMEVGWDCCHEVSAESGEGVEEVFRVITRKLVEQNAKIREQLLSAVQTPGTGMEGDVNGMGSEGGYFDGIMRPGGSFRVGRDRKSWLLSALGTPLGNPTPAVENGNVGEEWGNEQEAGQGAKRKGKCC